MPVMDGCEACTAIRALDRADAAAIPIVALTANDSAEDVSRTTQAGMDGHLAKPIDFDALARTLAELVTAYRAGRQ